MTMKRKGFKEALYDSKRELTLVDTMRAFIAIFELSRLFFMLAVPGEVDLDVSSRKTSGYSQVDSFLDCIRTLRGGNAATRCLASTHNLITLRYDLLPILATSYFFAGFLPIAVIRGGSVGCFGQRG